MIIIDCVVIDDEFVVANGVTNWDSGGGSDDNDNSASYDCQVGWLQKNWSQW